MDLMDAVKKVEEVLEPPWCKHSKDKVKKEPKKKPKRKPKEK